MKTSATGTVLRSSSVAQQVAQQAAASVNNLLSAKQFNNQITQQSPQHLRRCVLRCASPQGERAQRNNTYQELHSWRVGYRGTKAVKEVGLLEGGTKSPPTFCVGPYANIFSHEREFLRGVFFPIYILEDE